MSENTGASGLMNAFPLKFEPVVVNFISDALNKFLACNVNDIALLKNS